MQRTKEACRQGETVTEEMKINFLLKESRSLNNIYSVIVSREPNTWYDSYMV